MKKLLLLAMAVVLVGCGKKPKGSGHFKSLTPEENNTLAKIGREWDAEIKSLKSEVGDLWVVKADRKAEGEVSGEVALEPPADPPAKQRSTHTIPTVPTPGFPLPKPKK